MAEDEPPLPPEARQAHDGTDGLEPGPGATPPSPTLRRGTRLLLSVAGSLFILLGLVGLALPIIPQTVPLALGVALLSIASERVNGYLRTLLARWPRAWRTIQALRRRLESWLSR